MRKPRILFFSNWFSPGYKGGGSQTAAVNLVRSLQRDFDFHVITRDRDPGEPSSFRDVSVGRWAEWETARIRYLSPTELRLGLIESIVRQTPHDLIHLNSVVSLPFAAYPLLACRLRAASTAPFLISPHGEMAPGALAKKPLRKHHYLRAMRVLGILEGAIWHAANSQEEQDVKRALGTSAIVQIAPVVPPQYVFAPDSRVRPPKQRGVLRAVFFARIDRMKNLDLAIDMVAPVTDVTLDICGPVGQRDYWEICQAKIRASGRPDAFRYLGDVPTEAVGAALARYDALLLPSQSESFGYAVLDALAAGCPVLVSDRTPWHDLDQAGIGFDLPISRPDLFRARLTELRDLDEAGHSAVRARARSYARDYVQNSPAKYAMRAIYTKALARAT